MSHIPFVYKWTNKENNNWYIGSRTAKKCNPDDGYICSSKIVAPLIKNNPANWSREIINTGTVADMILLEMQLLVSLDAKNDPMSYNQHNSDGKFSMAGKVGGRTGKTPWNKGKTKETDATVAKYSKTLSIVNAGKKPVATTLGRAPWNKGNRGCQTAWNKGLPTEEQPFYGKTLDDAHRANLSESKLGDKNPMYGKDPWNKGLKGAYVQTPESNKKRAEKLSGKPRSEETKNKIKATKSANKQKAVSESITTTMDSQYLREAMLNIINGLK